MATKEIEINLDVIMGAKKQYLTMRQEKTGTPAIIALAAMQTLEQRPRPILNVVSSPNEVALIGQIRLSRTYDPVATALRYIRSGLDAVSLFTDERIYTQGLDDLLLVCRGVRKSPVLAQDVIVNEYHVAEARAAGASALTLYASLLDRPTLRRVVSATMRWQMTAIVQIATLEEMSYVSHLSPHVVAIGIDQHFIRERDLPLMESLIRHVPYNTKVMPLGCVKTLEDASDLLDLGVHAIVVDETLTGTPRKFEQLRMMVEDEVD